MTAMRRAIIALALIALWEAAYQFGALNPIIFGAPSLIIKAAITDGTSFLTAFRITLFEIAVATAIAWINGISLGVMLGASHLASRIADPIVAHRAPARHSLSITDGMDRHGASVENHLRRLVWHLPHRTQRTCRRARS